MKPIIISFLVVLSPAVSGASSPERAIIAAMRVSELPNYSWTSTVSDDARTYDIDGKTVRGGYTWVRLPMVKTIAQRLGRDAEREIEAVFRGTNRCVIRTDRGWKTLRELPKRSRSSHDDFEFWIPASSRVGMANVALAGLDPWDTAPMPPIMMPLPVRNDEEDRQPYSHAQFGVSHPHEELAIIVSSYTDLKQDGDSFVGTLSDLGAQLLLVRDGQDHIQTLAAGGAFRFRIKDGIVMKYQVQLEGILVVDRKRVHVHQTANTRVTNPGATAVDLTEELQRKLAE